MANRQYACPLCGKLTKSLWLHAGWKHPNAARQWGANQAKMLKLLKAEARQL